MDPLLLPYLQALDDIQRQERLDELLLLKATPVVRQTLRRRLGFHVDQRGTNPHNQDAEDLYQEIMAKVVHSLRDSTTTKSIENFQQYVARIASNACNDALRAKSPARARLKNNLRYVLSHHQDFAIWKWEGETLTGFNMWRDSSKSLSSVRQLANVHETVNNFHSERFARKDVHQVPLTRIVAELFLWTGSPIEVDVLVNIVAAVLEIKDQPHESVDEPNAYIEARVADSTLSSSSRLDEQALLYNLWQALKELSVEQRDVFCFGFEDESGRDFFRVVLEAEVVSFGELVNELGRSPETIMSLWSQMPMDDDAIAIELKTKRTQVQKWRFRALQRLKKGLLPFAGGR